jgi:divalent metal cation (Fe/Co/Zn/Cd) transporter
VLLAVVAVALGRDTKDLLIGEAATLEERTAITEIIEADPAVDRVLELLTMALAPDRLLVAARVDLADGLSADEIERASSEIDRELRERIPTVWQVFLDATPRSAAARPARAAEDRPRAADA